ncbi:MAG: cyclase family protein, partial [Bacteroidia bacterium]
MKASIKIGLKTFEANLDHGIDISIAVGKPNEVKAYGIPNSEITIYKDGGFVGDVLQGASCNVRDIKFNP